MGHSGVFEAAPPPTPILNVDSNHTCISSTSEPNIETGAGRGFYGHS